jgi:23S rRNA G2069 N7-methylase RlmK/C1962 C5-methylase RlmI
VKKHDAYQLDPINLSSSTAVCRLKPGKDKPIRHRHHWIFSGAIQSLPSFNDGDILPVISSSEQFLGYAYFNRKSSIIGRMIAFEPGDPLETIKRHIDDAVALREFLFKPLPGIPRTTAYRLINAEGDRLPGLIVDKYGPLLVIQISTLGMERLKGKIIHFLCERCAPAAIYEKSLLPSRKEEGLSDAEGWLWGAPINLETAGQDDQVMQDFELESLLIGGDHSQKVKAPPIRSDYSSKDCVNLSSSTAVSRFNLETAGQDDQVMQDFELESLLIGGDHSQKVKAPPIRSDCSSKDCVNLSSSTAVSRFKEVQVEENGLSFIVRPEESQKTGFFLDHREMRDLVRSLAEGKRVLNAFSYTGGFSVYALAGGASRVDSVDISEAAIVQAKRHVALNGFNPKEHGFYTADVFQFLREKDLNYDLVILDPPAFAKKKKDVVPGCRGYKDINRVAMQKMGAKTLLLTCSCSHHVDEGLFQQVVFQAAAEANRQVRIIGRHRLAPDHPVNLFHPESDYLKSLLLYLD